MGLRTAPPPVRFSSHAPQKLNLLGLVLVQVGLGLVVFQLVTVFYPNDPLAVAAYSDWLITGSAPVTHESLSEYRTFGPAANLVIPQPALRNRANIWLAAATPGQTTPVDLVLNGHVVAHVTLTTQFQIFSFDWTALSLFPTAKLGFQSNILIKVSQLQVENADLLFIRWPSPFITLLYIIIAAISLRLFYWRPILPHGYGRSVVAVIAPSLLLFAPLWLSLPVLTLFVLGRLFWGNLDRETKLASKYAYQKNLDNFLAVGLFGVALLTYNFTTSNQLNGSNDGSHLALARSIAETGKFEISPFLGYALMLDYSQTPNGKYYSDRPPGTGWIAAGLVKAAKTTASSSLLAAQLPALGLFAQNNGPLWEGFNWVLLLPTFCGAMSLALLFKLSRFLGLSRLASVVAVSYMGFGTLVWKYSLTLYSHVPGMALILGGVYLNLSAGSRRWRTILGCGLLGYACTVDYTNGLPAMAVLLYLLWVNRHTIPRWRQNVNGWLWPMVVFGLPLLALAVYQTICFGSPFNTSYTYSGKWEWARSLGTTFTRNPLDGSLQDFFFGSKTMTGLLSLSPALALAVWGAYFAWKRQRSVLFLLLGLIIPITLLMSCHYTYFGGGDEDARYLLVMLPYLSLLLAFWLDSWVVSLKLVAKVIWLVLFLGVFVYSLFANGYHLYHDYPFRYQKYMGRQGLDNFGLPNPLRPILVNPAALPLALFALLLLLFVWQLSFQPLTRRTNFETEI